MLAMASVKSPSPASRLLQVLCRSSIPEHPQNPCRSRLAGDGAHEIAIASKPGSYKDVRGSARTARQRQANGLMPSLRVKMWQKCA